MRQCLTVSKATGLVGGCGIVLLLINMESLCLLWMASSPRQGTLNSIKTEKSNQPQVGFGQGGVSQQQKMKPEQHYNSPTSLASKENTSHSDLLYRLLVHEKKYYIFTSFHVRLYLPHEVLDLKLLKNFLEDSMRKWEFFILYCKSCNTKSFCYFNLVLEKCFKIILIIKIVTGITLPWFHQSIHIL